MKYQYYNTFYLSEEFSKVLSDVISQKEGKKYICKTLLIRIPEHKGLVFQSPLEGYNPWGGGLKALSGAEINYINEKFGKYEIGTIPEQEYPFFVVIDEDSLDQLQAMNFEDKEEIYNALRNLAAYSARYRDISFDSRGLVQRFPYLKCFFSTLDEWRAETGRVTVDDEILEKGARKVLTP